MASGYTAIEYFATGSMSYRGYLTASVTSETATTATVSYTATVQMRYAYLYGVGIKISGGKSKTGYLTSNPGSSWKNVCSVSGTFKVDKKASKFNYSVTAKAYGTKVGGVGAADSDSESVTVKVAIPAMSYQKPDAVTGTSATRNSDTRATVKWTNNTSSKKPYSSIKIERATNGGAWSQIASVSKNATSYVDTSVAPNGYYRYRIRPYNPAGYGSYATTGIVYNTPAAPTKVTAARLVTGGVGLTITNPANTATALEIQRSEDKETWETIATKSGKVTEATDAPGDGTFYYRARNTRGTLVSDWSPESAAVITICAPDIPTLVSPASSTVLETLQPEITFQWQHNTLDGSVQTAAQVRYCVYISYLDEDWVTLDVEGDADSLTIENSFSANDKVKWNVRTKGAADDWSEWSANRYFDIAVAPVVYFEEPENGAIIEKTPVNVSIKALDESGSFTSGKFQVIGEDKVLYERELESLEPFEVTKEQWAPVNGEDYTLIATVNSTSRLSGTANVPVTIQFKPPRPADLDVEFDEETGICSIMADASAKSWALTGTNSVEVESLDTGTELTSLTVYGKSLVEGTTTNPKPVQTVENVSITLGSWEYGATSLKLADHPSGARDALVVDDEGNVSVVTNVYQVEVQPSTESWTESEGMFVLTATETYTADEYAFCDYGACILGEHTVNIPSGDVEFETFVSTYGNTPFTVYYTGETTTETLTTTEPPTLETPFSFEATAKLDVDVELELNNGDVDPVTVTVSRIYNGERKVLCENIDVGSALIDKYVPLNEPLVYEVVTAAESGATTTVTVDFETKTPWWFFYFNNEGIARAKWNPETDITKGRPSDESVVYWGRDYPVLYEGKNLSDERSFSAALMTKEEANAFNKLLEYGGRCVYKSGDGDVFHAYVTHSITPVYSTAAYYGTIAVNITRIDGDEL